MTRAEKVSDGANVEQRNKPDERKQPDSSHIENLCWPLLVLRDSRMAVPDGGSMSEANGKDGES